MRPVRNVFQKLSRTEQRREGVVAYLWCYPILRYVHIKYMRVGSFVVYLHMYDKLQLYKRVSIDSSPWTTWVNRALYIRVRAYSNVYRCTLYSVLYVYVPLMCTVPGTVRLNFIRHSSCMWMNTCTPFCTVPVRYRNTSDMLLKD